MANETYSYSRQLLPREAAPVLGAAPFDMAQLAESNLKHVSAVLDFGGFPRAAITETGRTEWLGPDGKRWGRLAHKQQVKRNRAA